MSTKPPGRPPGISRREAILLSLGQADRVALERERQSAIDAAGGGAIPAEDQLPRGEEKPRRGLGRRRDVPEIEDQPWFPSGLRDAMTGYLRVVIEKTRPYEFAAPRLSALLRELGSEEILDLASGAGGPWPELADRLRREGVPVRVTLTDLAPNRDATARLAGAPAIRYLTRPVSALEVPSDLHGTRTMFSALHHFGPAEVRSILLSAQNQRVGFAAFEATHRSVRGVLLTLLVPLLALVFMPLVRPRRAAALLLTYLPPVLPLLIWWDGLASTLRTYRAEELREIVRGIEAPGYSWRVEELRVPKVPIPVLQVIGRPERGA